MRVDGDDRPVVGAECLFRDLLQADGDRRHERVRAASLGEDALQVRDRRRVRDEEVVVLTRDRVEPVRGCGRGDVPVSGDAGEERSFGVVTQIAVTVLGPIRVGEHDAVGTQDVAAVLLEWVAVGRESFVLVGVPQRGRFADLEVRELQTQQGEARQRHERNDADAAVHLIRSPSSVSRTGRCRRTPSRARSPRPPFAPPCKTAPRVPRGVPGGPGGRRRLQERTCSVSRSV